MRTLDEMLRDGFYEKPYTQAEFLARTEEMRLAMKAENREHSPRECWEIGVANVLQQNPELSRQEAERVLRPYMSGSAYAAFKHGQKD